MTQLDLPYSLPFPFSGRPCVLQVPHFVTGQGLASEMVGKIIPHLGAGLVFYHAHSGSQYHRKYDCPAPVDCCVIQLLRGEGISLVYSYDRKRCVLYRTRVEQFLGAAIEMTASRARYYLSMPYWERRDRITERRERGNRILVDAIGTPVFQIPFLREPIHTLRAERF